MLSNRVTLKTLFEPVEYMHAFNLLLATAKILAQRETKAKSLEGYSIQDYARFLQNLGKDGMIRAEVPPKYIPMLSDLNSVRLFYYSLTTKSSPKC